MNLTTSIQSGAKYLCIKFGEVVNAIEQVAIVKGLPLREVERQSGSGLRNRLIVSVRTLIPAHPADA